MFLLILKFSMKSFSKHECISSIGLKSLVMFALLLCKKTAYYGRFLVIYEAEALILG